MSFTSIIHSVIGLRHYRASGKLIRVHRKPRTLHRIFTQRYLGKLENGPSLDELIGMVLKCVKNAFLLYLNINFCILAQPNTGKIVINDEERLNMLHKKARLLRQQYSALGPQNQMSQGGMNIKRQIDDVNRQTLQLEPSVKMKNPTYQPPRPGVSTPLKEANGQIRVGKLY